MAKNKTYTSVYELDGRVPLGRAVPLGIQHVLAMFVGNVTPLIIICGMCGMDSATRTMLIQNAMFVAGIVTLIQLYPLLTIGAKLPIVMGTSFGFMGTMRIIAANPALGYPAIMGAALIGGIFELCLGFFIKPLRKLFPTVVTSLVVVCIGLSLLGTGIGYFGGGTANTAEAIAAAGKPAAMMFGSWQNLTVGFVVLIIIVLLKQFGKGFMSHSSILIGIIIGYVLAIPLGLVDFAPIREAAWFALPKPYLQYSFHAEAIIPMLIMFVATTIETMGDTAGITRGGMDREPTDKEMAGAVKADGIGSAFATIFGVLPNTSFSQNVGLVGITKVVNRFTVMTGAVVLILTGFFPKLAALFNAMPQSVLGGAAVVMFAMIIVSGIQSMQTLNLSGRNGMIVAVSLGLGVGVSQMTDVLAQLPGWVTTMFAQNGIIMTFIIATVMNLVLPADKKTSAQETGV